MTTIRLNGNEVEVAQGMTVGSLLDSKGVNPKRVVVELNRQILPREAYGDTVLEAGDVMEVVTFVGGG
jgi:thiamine biosynthesis protein ThiS